MKLILWLLLLFGALPACGDDATLIIATVNGRAPEVQVLRVSVTLDGRRTTMPEDITDGLDQFGLLLPAGASGPFLLEADGMDKGGCVVSQGKTDTTLTGQSRVRLNLPLTKLTTPVCDGTR